MEFLPPVLLRETSSERSGVEEVTSSKADTVMKRRAGDVGLYFLIAIVLSPYARLSKNSIALLSAVRMMTAFL